MNFLKILFIILIFYSQSISAEESISNDNKLIIGLKEAPPFVIHNKDNSWSGISIELWKQIAKANNINYEFKEYSLKSLFENIQQGSIHLAIGAITMTADREKKMDFSYPFYNSGLGIAVSKSSSTSTFQIIKNLISFDFLKVILILFTILTIIGILVWLSERHSNPSQFDKGVLKGVGSGFWWSAVTMTTVGYGDKAPVSFIGRILAVVWMFASIIIISSFTAAIAASLTVNQLGSIVRGVDDLPKVRVATIQDSSSEIYLKQKQISYTTFETIPEALKKLEAKEIDALVYDSPILKYQINLNHSDSLVVLSDMVERQDYAIVLTQNSPLREPVNQVILQTIRSPEWNQLLYHFLGK